jgi:hypothetical protein
MRTIQQRQAIAYTYLILVPFLTAAAGFGIGHISYTIYLPIWIANIILMLIGAWWLGLHFITKKENELKQSAWGGFLLISPWLLLSILFGFGPPPDKAADWAATATEQEIRYSFLTIAGILLTMGFASLRDKMKGREGAFFSLLGYTAILIAIPLFILNMLFWGFFLTASFNIITAAGIEKMPEWFVPIRKLFGLISVVEVALIYFATAAFAMALHETKWISNTSKKIYVSISITAFLFIVLSVYFPEPFITAGFAVSIPAIPFIMPYFMGIHLLRRINNY